MFSPTRHLSLLIMTSMLAGCSTLKLISSPGKWTAKNSFKQIEVETDQQANFGNGIELELVFFLEKGRDKELPANARDWFRSDHYRQGLGNAIVTKSQTFSADRDSEVMHIPEGIRQARTIWLMANFFGPNGVPPHNLTGAKRVKVLVKRDTLEVTAP